MYGVFSGAVLCQVGQEAGVVVIIGIGGCFLLGLIEGVDGMADQRQTTGDAHRQVG